MPPGTEPSRIPARERLIVALDVENAADALEMVQAIGDSAGVFKVGKQLFTAEGPDLIRQLVSRRHKVFLDLKFHDIPNTVAAAVRSAAGLGVHMLTVHASGGRKMLVAAAEAAQASPSRPIVLAVTVLTSMTDSDLSEVGISRPAAEQVALLARLAKDAGCGGLVCSPWEAQALRRLVGTEMALVTPGVRPAGSDKGDQARVATPADAIRAGASHVVVGRPITVAADPGQAAKAILQEIESAL
jgi:orotidine-5'-phosphate decarboxylase